MTVGHDGLEDRRIQWSKVTIWDPLSGKCLQVLEDRVFDGIHALAVSPDSQFVAAGMQNNIVLWNAETGKQEKVLQHQRRAVWSIAFSPDGKTLAIAGEENGKIELWDLATGRPKQSFESSRGTVAVVEFAPDGKTLVSGGGRGFDSPGELLLWDLASGKIRAKWKIVEDWPIVSLAFSADGKTLATGSRGSPVKLWEWETGKVKATLEGPLNLTKVAFSADGKYLAASGGTHDPIIAIGGIYLWDLHTGKRRLSPTQTVERERREASQKKRETEQARVRAEREQTQKRLEERLTPSERVLLAEKADRARRTEYALGLAQAQMAITRWEYQQARQILDGLRPKQGESDLRSFDWHYLWGQLAREVVLVDNEGETATPMVAISPQGDAVALRSEAGIAIYNTYSGKKGIEINTDQKRAAAMAFSPDGQTLATGEEKYDCAPAEVKLWDVTTGKLKREFKGSQNCVCAIAFSRDGQVLAAAGHDNKVRLWNVAAGKLLHTLEGHTWIVNTLAFSPDGKWVASGTAIQPEVFIWDVQTGKQKGKLRCGPSTLAFAPSGRNLVVNGNGLVVFYDLDTLKPTHSLRTNDHSLHFLGDGQYLATGLNLYEPLTGKELACWESGVISCQLPPRESLRQTAVSNTGNLTGVYTDPRSIRFVTIPLQVGQPIHLSTKAWRVAYSSNGKDMLVVNDEKQVTRHSASDGRPRLRWPRLGGDKTARLVFSPGKEPRVRIDATELTLAEAVDLGICAEVGVKNNQLLKGLSADGRILLTTEDNQNTLTLWDTQAGKARVNLPTKGGSMSYTAFSPDGQLLVVVLDDVSVWNTKTGAEIDRFEKPAHSEVRAVRFSEDGKRLTTLAFSDWNSHTASFWDLAMGEMRMTLRGHTKFFDAIAFSPDGRLIATGSSDQTVRLWDAVTGQPRGVLRGRLGLNPCLAFRPDSKALAACEFDGSVNLWNTENTDLLADK